MASQCVAFLMIAVFFTIGSCESESDIDIDIKGCENGLCEIKPAVYEKYQALIDDRMETIQKKFKPMNDDVLFESSLRRNIGGNCRTESKIIKPFIYRGNSTKLVVQSKFFEQKFMTTTCKKPRIGRRFRSEKYVRDAQCLDSMGLENNGYTASCKPKQTTIKLYVYDVNKDEIQRVPVEIDVCCTCEISYPQPEDQD